MATTTTATMTIMSNIPFQPTTLKEAEEIIQKRYAGITPEIKSRGLISLRTFTNETHHFQLRLTQDQLESREVPV